MVHPRDFDHMEEGDHESFEIVRPHGFAGVERAPACRQVSLFGWAQLADPLQPGKQLLPLGGEIHVREIDGGDADRSEEQTSELQSLMRSSYAVFCLKKT